MATANQLRNAPALDALAPAGVATPRQAPECPTHRLRSSHWPHAERLHRQLLAFDLDGVERRARYRRWQRLRRLLADPHFTRGRLAREPRRQIHRVANDRVFHL